MWILTEDVDLHDKINCPQFPHACLYRLFQTLQASYIHLSDADDLRTLSCSRNVLCHGLGLGGVPAYDASIGAEMDDGAYLGAADCAGATGTEDDFPSWK